MFLLHPRADNVTTAGLHNHSQLPNRPGPTLREIIVGGTKLITAHDIALLSSQTRMIFLNGHLAISTGRGIDHHPRCIVDLLQSRDVKIWIGYLAIGVGVGVGVGVVMRSPAMISTMNTSKDRHNSQVNPLEDAVAHEIVITIAVRPRLVECGLSTRDHHRKGCGAKVPKPLIEVPPAMILATKVRNHRFLTGGVGDRNSQQLEYNEAVIPQLSIKGASKPIAESTSIPALGLSIKGQAAKMGLKRTKSSDEDRIPYDQTQQSVRDVDLPSLLARMTDPAHPQEKRTSANDVAPSVADIMVRTRRQLSIKRKGKGKAVDSNGLDEDAETSLRQTELMSDEPQQLLDTERRRQLMAKLAEERKKFLRSDSPRSDKPLQHNEASSGPDLNAHEQRLRAQARLRLKLASEKRQSPAVATHHNPRNSNLFSINLSPVEISPTPAPSTSSPEPLLLLEDGLKAKLQQRRIGASLEEDLKERLRTRKQSLG
ncbi:hypothetical protein FRC00_002515 [Tulasnella sp. 408]|nr:hypothetical protein FRC00_002515 [Tulasnella sp. 408]